ncbi:hypothetical protein QC763_0095000 [Podospora pseudopauciseta]|uniref:Uncharacterized protein n=2 Tax=Podospora TaxID=5144 RepID=A0ABR0H4W2_9PEZI|nr:hypothetical protein QC763_0095000 [Podospora pseudopauciseta]KAK4671416.1 hypothetical protein QC764_0095010 [Podospora pseudoanserina]
MAPVESTEKRSLIVASVVSGCLLWSVPLIRLPNPARPDVTLARGIFILVHPAILRRLRQQTDKSDHRYDTDFVGLLPVRLFHSAPKQPVCRT